jgi:thiamine biosynthesis lipoprotein
MLVVLYFSWPRKRVEADSGYRLVMGTFARLKAVTTNQDTAKKCIDTAFARLQKVDDLMSDYKSSSEISLVNTDAFEKPVKVSESTFEVLEKSLEFSRLSEGAFDITVGPLIDLWRSAAEVNSVPTDAKLAEVRSRVGYEKLLLNPNEMTVQFAVEGMKLDLGGIAKGYAIDKAIEAMKAGGAIGGMVDVGGDIRCFGLPSQDRDNWRIGLQDPTRTKVTEPNQTGVLLVLELTDAAVATSGHYRRFVLIDGKKYSHIMDRKTGAGAQGLSSATIITTKAIDADALATIVSVMGAEKGLALIETMPITEAILITPPPEYKLVKTTGADKYIKQNSTVTK